MSSPSPLKHIAVIPDGNGRWAKRQMRPRMFGHKRGAKVVKEIVKAASQQPGLEVLSLFVFSTENKQRPADEVTFLMQLLASSLDDSVNELHENNIRLRIIGDQDCYPDRLKKRLQAAEELTANNTGLTLVCAFFYSGKWDLTQATQRIAQATQSGELSPDAINEETIAQHLSMSDLPDPDLLIRTSGEQRISNFMLWQFAYTELFFTDKLWPDFTAEDFQASIDAFHARDRRFGKVKATN